MSYPGRVSTVELAQIVDVDADLDLTWFIDSANELVTEVCAGVLKADGVTAFYTAHRLKLIELWLSAHFYCIEDARTKRERVGRIHIETQSKVELGLDVTHYGQQAKRLDTNGGLAALDKALTDGKIPGRFTCTLKWLGNRDYSGPAYD